MSENRPLMFWYNKDTSPALPSCFSNIYFTPDTYAEYVKIILDYRNKKTEDTRINQNKSEQNRLQK